MCHGHSVTRNNILGMPSLPRLRIAAGRLPAVTGGGSRNAVTGWWSMAGRTAPVPSRAGFRPDFPGLADAPRGSGHPGRSGRHCDRGARQGFVPGEPGHHRDDPAVGRAWLDDHRDRYLAQHLSPASRQPHRPAARVPHAGHQPGAAAAGHGPGRGRRRHASAGLGLAQQRRAGARRLGELDSPGEGQQARPDRIRRLSAADASPERPRHATGQPADLSPLRASQKERIRPAYLPRKSPGCGR